MSHRGGMPELPPGQVRGRATAGTWLGTANAARFRQIAATEETQPGVLFRDLILARLEQAGYADQARRPAGGGGRHPERDDSGWLWAQLTAEETTLARQMAAADGVSLYAWLKEIAEARLAEDGHDVTQRPARKRPARPVLPDLPPEDWPVATAAQRAARKDRITDLLGEGYKPAQIARAVGVSRARIGQILSSSSEGKDQ